MDRRNQLRNRFSLSRWRGRLGHQEHSFPQPESHSVIGSEPEPCQRKPLRFGSRFRSHQNTPEAVSPTSSAQPDPTINTPMVINSSLSTTQNPLQRVWQRSLEIAQKKLVK